MTSLPEGTKPRKDFPLSWHKASRQWCKKVRGKVRYFGRNTDAALDEWLAKKDYWLSGKEPPTPAATPDGLTVKELCNEFLHAFKDQVDAGKRSARTWTDYRGACKRTAKAFGPGRLVDDLQPTDFAKLRKEFARTHGAQALTKDVQMVRTLFHWGEDNKNAKATRYGSMFDKPTKREMRDARSAKGKLKFEPEQVRAMLVEAKQPLRAMLLLALNTGFGNHDVATLPLSALDLDNGWIDFARPKTGIARRVPLWPETVAALREAIAKRPKAKGAEHKDRVFVTLKGNSWERKQKDTESGVMLDDPISKETAKLLNKLEMKRPGLNFYSCRRSFQTYGAKSRDAAAVSAIMGHVPKAGDMAALYDQDEIEDERLIAVVNFVRQALLVKAKAEAA